MSDEKEENDSFVSTLFASGGILFVGLMIQFGIGFFAKIIIARYLGPVDYGGVALGIVLLGTVSTVVLVGTNTGVSRYLPRHDSPARRRGILLSSFQIALPLAVVAGLVIAIFAEPIARYAFKNPSIASIIRVFGLAVPLAVLVRLTVGTIRGMQETVPRVYINNISIPLARFGLIAVVVLVGLGTIGVAWAYLGAYGIGAALSLYYLIRHTPLFERIKAVSMRRELLVFSAPLMVTATMNTVLGNFDTLMLGYFAGAGIVGIYQVVYPLASKLPITLRAFGFIFLPMISEFHSEGRIDEMKRMYQVVTKWIFIVTLPLFLVIAFYPRLVIRNTFGPEYVAGGLALSVLAIGFFTHTIAGPSGNTLISVGRSRLIMYIQVTGAAVNVVLNLILIPRYSLLGAAIATTISYALMNAIYVVYVYRIVGTHPFTGALLRPGVAAIVLWLPFYWILETYLAVNVPILVIEMLVFMSLYIIVILRFGGVEQEELMLLRQFEDRSGIDLDPLRAVARRVVR